MKKNYFVIICLRLLGIYFGVLGLSSLPSIISMVTQSSGNTQSYFFIGPVIFIASGLILCIYAKKISRYIVEFSEAEKDEWHITVSEKTTRIALLVLGIYIFTQTLPQLIQLSIEVGLYYKNAAEIPKHLSSIQPRWTYLIGPILKLFISIVLIIGPDKIADLLSKYDDTFRKMNASNPGVEKDER